MKAFAVLQLAVLVATTIAFKNTEEWEVWKTKHGKIYKDDSEELHRRTIWASNKIFVEEHNKNSDKHGFMVEMNKFADLENIEFARIFNGYHRSLPNKPNRSGRLHKPSGVQTPSSVDWRIKGVVTGVKDQGQCGSCWAFSTTGAVESQYAINTGKLVSLSEQQLIDCSTFYFNFGCNGGEPELAFTYLMTVKAERETDYPYNAKNGTCQYDPTKGLVSVGNHTNVASEDEKALLDAVATVGPISVSMDASEPGFQLYKDGVYSNKNCSSSILDLDHAVLAVGYGVSLIGKDYWIVKNSWGEDWGDKGYFKLARNDGNMCGIATNACYPTGVN